MEISEVEKEVLLLLLPIIPQLFVVTRYIAFVLLPLCLELASFLKTLYYFI